nr:SCO family protein [Kofleriaceae bacterium]
MPTGKRVLGWMLVVLVFAVVPGIVVPTLMCRREVADLKDWGVIPAFQLVDERGQEFTEEALRGHPTIVSFLFTRCDTICPITTAKMRNLQEITADLGDRIKLLSFTVDPGYDTPERLDAYAQKFTADPERWRFVTGDPARERALVEGAFMTSTVPEGTRPSGVPNIAHGGYFMLVDAELHLRGSYDSNSPTELDQLQKDARYLARVGH